MVRSPVRRLLWARRFTTFNSIPINLILLANKNVALKYSVIICKQNTNGCAAPLMFSAFHSNSNLLTMVMRNNIRGGEWYLEKRGYQKMLAGSRNLGSVFGKSRFCMVCFYLFLSPATFYQKVSDSDF